MKLIFAAVMIVGSTSIALAQYYGTGSNPESHYTSGYTRNDGTYVAPHYQTNPNGSTSITRHVEILIRTLGKPGTAALIDLIA